MFLPPDQSESDRLRHIDWCPDHVTLFQEHVAQQLKKSVILGIELQHIIEVQRFERNYAII